MHGTTATPDEYAQEEYLAAKGWNSGITLTTFVQLFESLVRPANQQAMKLPAIYNSVIILDEPQTLPLDWWRLIRRLVATLVEEYGATVISMTATQPRILTAETCPFEVHGLVDKPGQYFELVERVEYQYHPTLETYLADPDIEDETNVVLTHDEAGETVIANLSAEESTGLAICNTVASAVALTDAIDDAAATAGYEQLSLGEVYTPLARCDDATFEPVVDDDGEEETLIECRARALLEALDAETESARTPLVTLHLTTRHRPIDRKVLLEAADRLSEERDVSFVFVATQLVEAGVDVSFTRVYRDFAPISSIVQAAGRCNRSAERDRGTITIWRLEKTEGSNRPPSELVYASGEYNKLGPTARALNEVAPARPADSTSRTVRELAVAREGVQKYYYILDKERDVGRQKYVDWVDTAQFDKLRELSLIDERPAFDVLVCRSAEEHDRGETLLKALDDKETAVAYEQLSALEETQVPLPESEVHGEIPRDAQPAVFGRRLVFIIDDYVGEGNFLPRTGLHG
ncbi:CRISPR-associated helicase/endonuclease Cas3 (plasmid) [Haloferacaceae archaeon DSL9]